MRRREGVEVAGGSRLSLGGLLAVGALLGWTALLAGCPDAGTPPGEGENATPPVAAPIEAKGPVLKLGVVGDTRPVLDELVHDTLLRLDEDASIAPGLAKKWSDGKQGTWRFVLRSGLTFHPHPCLPVAAGERTLTARDVAWSIEQAARTGLFEGLPIRGLDSWLEGKEPRIFGVQTEGAEVVVIQLQRPAAFLLHRLAEVRVKPRALKRCDLPAAKARPVGTGPFLLNDSPGHDGAARLVANPVYWERIGLSGRLPHVGGIDVRSVADGAAGAREIDGGSLDVVLLSPERAETVIADQTARRPALAEGLGVDPERVVPFVDVRQREHQLVVLAFVARDGRPWLTQEPVRRAIGHAINRTPFRPLDPLLLTPTTRYLYPQLAGYEVTRPQVHYDWDIARTLLAEAGLELASMPPLDVAIPARFAGVAEPLQGMLERIGLKMRVVGADEPADLVVRLVSSGLTGREPWPFLRDLTSGLADAGLPDPELEAILEQVEVQEDPKVRAQYYDRIEEQVLMTRPFVPLGRRDSYTPLSFGLVGPAVSGLHDPESRRAVIVPGTTFARAKLTRRSPP